MSGETRTRVGTPTDVGSRLRAAREAKQLSVHAIAKTTKIPVGALEALEENDVARLPGGIFSRGFVRSYAAAVGLNPEQTLRDFVAQLPAHETATGAASDDRPHGYHQSTRQRRVAGLGLGVLLVWSAGATLLFVVGIPGMPTRTGIPPGRPSRWHRSRRFRLVWRSRSGRPSPLLSNRSPRPRSRLC